MPGAPSATSNQAAQVHCVGPGGGCSQVPCRDSSSARAAATAASRAAIHSASVISGMSSVVSRLEVSAVDAGASVQGSQTSAPFGSTRRRLHLVHTGHPAHTGQRRPASCGASAVLAFGECPQPVRGGVLLAVGPGAGAGVVPPSGVTGALLGGDGRRGGGGRPALRASLSAPR